VLDAVVKNCRLHLCQHASVRVSVCSAGFSY
jgi:hypothetical protein